MTLKPPLPRSGYVKRGQLDRALEERDRFFIDGKQQLPPSSTTPSGTGFRHVTGGVEDAAAKLVDTDDINPNQVTYEKIQETLFESVLLGRGQGLGAGEIEEIDLGDGLEMVGSQLRATAQAVTFSYLWQSKTPATVLTGNRFNPDRDGEILWIRLEVVLGDGLATAEVDVLKNGATIFSVSARPTVNASGFVGAEVTPDDVDFEKDNDFLQVQVLNAASTQGALRLLIHFSEVLP